MLTVIWLLFLIGQGSTQYVYNEESEERTLNTAVETPTCPGVWSRYVSTANKTGCFCGDNLGGVVKCNNKTLQVELLPCYCITPSEKNLNMTVVGACMSTCHLPSGTRYISIHSNRSDLSDYFCNGAIIHKKPSWNRNGQLCGSCRPKYAASVYTYNWYCTSCSDNRNLVTNVFKYCVIAYLPLTIFFIIVITLSIRANSPSINAVIIILQIIASPLLLRLFSVLLDIPASNVVVIKLVAVSESLCAFWNLDFFRTLYPHFCLHSNMGTLQVLALDYIIGAYPLLLIAVTYSLVELHDHNCRIVVWLWKPFCRISCFQRQWNIRNSLIETFVTFLLLSYVMYLLIYLFLCIHIMLKGSHWNHSCTMMEQLNTLANSTYPMLSWQL